MKFCFKCHQEKELSEFYSHNQMADGTLNKCKECTKADVKKNYSNNRDYYVQYEKERASLPHRVEARRAYAKTIEGIIAGNRCKIAYIKRNPEKRAAHIIVGNAIRDGKLIRQSCEVCANEFAHAHHDDYSRPLEVRWLCPQCHRDEHQKEAVSTSRPVYRNEHTNAQMSIPF